MGFMRTSHEGVLAPDGEYVCKPIYTETLLIVILAGLSGWVC